jgi:hypothetical protein
MPAGRGAELIVAGLLVVALAWLGGRGWRFYAVSILPYARAVPTTTATPVPDPEGDRRRARQMRQLLDHVGAGISLRDAGQRAAAIREFENALAIDPANFEARQNLRDMGIEPPAGAVVNTPVPATVAPLPTVTPRL